MYSCMKGSVVLICKFNLIFVFCFRLYSHYDKCEHRLFDSIEVTAQTLTRFLPNHFPHSAGSGPASDPVTFNFNLVTASHFPQGRNLTCEVAFFFCFHEDKSALLFPTVSKRRRVSGNGQFLSSSSSSWRVLTVDSESCSWRWEVKSPQRVKRSLFNVPLFTNTPQLMKACPCLLNYVCSITQRTSAIALFLWIWFPQLFLCREGKIHILFSFVFYFCTKALNET